MGGTRLIEKGGGISLGRIQLGEAEEEEIHLGGEMLIGKCVLKKGDSCVEFVEGNGRTNCITRSRSAISRRCDRSAIALESDVAAAADLMENYAAIDPPNFIAFVSQKHDLVGDGEGGVIDIAVSWDESSA
jgi:hypothetical protein